MNQNRPKDSALDANQINEEQISSTPQKNVKKDLT